MEGAAIDTLTKSVLGALVVVLLTALYYKDRQLIVEKDKRLADAQQQTAKVTEAFQESSKVYQMLTDKIEAGKKGK